LVRGPYIADRELGTGRGLRRGRRFSIRRMRPTLLVAIKTSGLSAGFAVALGFLTAAMARRQGRAGQAGSL
jgi:hypothetical protein